MTYTDQQIATTLGISADTVQAARIGRSKLGIKHRQTLIRAFGRETADLLCPERQRKSVVADYQRLRSVCQAIVTAQDSAGAVERLAEALR